MRVTHLVPALFDPNDGVIGGAERYAFELARHMADRVPTTLLTFGDRDRRETRGNLAVRVIGKPWRVRGQVTNPFSLAMIPELRNATVVHCHQHHVVASSVAALFCRLTGRRVFVSDLGGGGWDISSYVSTDRWYHGQLHLSQYSLSLASDTHSGRAHVILGGVDTATFSPGQSEARSGNTVLFVGRILPHKGIDTLIQAMPEDMELQVVGRVTDRRYLADLRAMAQGKRVIFRLDCDDAAIVDAYRRALCLVLPSTYVSMYGNKTLVPELLGQTLLEAMACETAAVCTNVASMPEVVENGVTGIVVPDRDPGAMAEAIALLRSHPETAMTMGQAGRRRVLDRFTWPKVVERCLAIYNSA